MTQTTVESAAPPELFPRVEADLLVTMMADPWAWDAVGNILTPQHFTKDAGAVFDAISTLVVATKPCHMEAVAMLLNRDASTRKLSVELPQRLAAGSKGDPRPLAIMLHEEFVLQQIRIQASRLLDISEPGANAALVLQNAAEVVEKLIDALPLHAEIKPLGELIVRELDSISEAGEPFAKTASKKSASQDLGTMLLELLQPGRLVGLVGADSMGKTTLATQILRESLLTSGPALFATMEMSNSDITKKLLAGQAAIPIKEMTIGQLNDDQWPQLHRAVETLRGAAGDGFLDDTATQTLSGLASKGARIKRQSGKLGLVVIDHLGTMTLEPGQTQQQLAAGFKRMARQLDTAVLLLSHTEDALRISADVILRLIPGDGPGARILQVTKNKRDETLDGQLTMDLTLHGDKATFLATHDGAAGMEHRPAPDIQTSQKAAAGLPQEGQASLI